MFAWEDGREQSLERPHILAWPLVILRAVLVALVIFALMIPLLVLRVLGQDAWGQRIVRFACRTCLRIIGLRIRVIGTPLADDGALVANHSSWLDIFSLHAANSVYFVSKADVEGWPLIGAIAKSAGTVFIERRTSHAGKHKHLFMDRISRAHRLLFFPEGTSTDGRRVLRFRSSLFAAFLETAPQSPIWVQPVTLNYHAPKGDRVDFYGWWGDMGFFEHFVLILSRVRHGHIELVFHTPLNVQDFSCRKDLALGAENAVRAGLTADPS